MPSIARAFTTRRVKMSLELAQEARERAAVQRSNTVNAAPARSKLDSENVYRPKISGPVELIHTTNMLSYNAPDLPRPSTSGSSQLSTKSAKSSNSDNESDSAPGTAASSPPTSPDVSPSELKRSLSPEPNHLSCYFMTPQQIQDPRPAPSIPAPTIPQRSPSHTKQASMEAMTRQRSTGRLQKPNPRAGSMSRSNGVARSPAHSVSPSTASSHRSFQSQSSVSLPPPPTPVSATMPHSKAQLAAQHPFSQELAQVTEMAEEFGINERINVIDEEERELISRGLCKFSADVYLHDIQTLTATFFNDRDARQSRPAPALWI
ncbi:uncharacterized protein DNG_00712 [Cephalotrichum gorgonifer]|uniref:Uncharacterized protein n=1 Tax=Cephalotrichum gorgonifer TaxID=2041049 RepID=A0AAE8SRH2_9PEZI|nr:uncharacterized protein DNG_00712 [Cephalotrichum gorgonifer]